MTDDAIPAATLIVVRDRADGPPELLMVERSEGMAFAAGALVFPGGRIDAADAGCPDPDMRGAASRQSAKPIEETAVPVGLDTRSPIAKPRSRSSPNWPAARISRTLLARPGLSVDAAALTPFARWVPKFHAVRRFDTLFFVADARRANGSRMSSRTNARALIGCRAAEALDREERGEARLIFPTRRNLERLA